ncbi:uncharacterized protein LOC125156170 [Prionailurus viverrinus]|uniref:uncharacterized protein LOC125156170 n=1 Tax=Prionailurus viverrinus TaxID=61388 RepID=UPI001FF35C47|nr:uncharacterized protein LOC125156170 [Prionailurus viverrinus]
MDKKLQGRPTQISIVTSVLSQQLDRKWTHGVSHLDQQEGQTLNKTALIVDWIQCYLEFQRFSFTSLPGLTQVLQTPELNLPLTWSFLPSAVGPPTEETRPGTGGPPLAILSRWRKASSEPSQNSEDRTEPEGPAWKRDRARGHRGGVPLLSSAELQSLNSPRCSRKPNLRRPGSLALLNLARCQIWNLRGAGERLCGDKEKRRVACYNSGEEIKPQHCALTAGSQMFLRAVFLFPFVVFRPRSEEPCP